MTPSILTKKQTKEEQANFQDEQGNPCVLIAKIRFDDECNNGHNTFAITGTLYETRYIRGESSIFANGKRLYPTTCGCVHDLIAEHIPKLKPYLKWHGVTTDGPLHYIENAMYWAGDRGFCDGKPGSPPNWNHFRSTAVWGACPTFDDVDPQVNHGPRDIQNLLEARKPELMKAFRQAVESLGFTY